MLFQDLDGGTFVFEVGGQRWGMDMSSDNYSLKNYFTQSLEYRYSYYRKSTAGHNTLTFNNNGADWAGCDQEPGMAGRTQITLFEGTSANTRAAMAAGAGANPTTATVSSSPAYSIVDLTAAYGRQNSSRVERGFAFTASYQHLIIVDEFEFAARSSVHNVTWSMHTMADIKVKPAGSAALTLGGATLHATILEPKGAVFTTMEVNLQPPYDPSVGVRKLLVALPIGAGLGVPGGTAPLARIVVGLSTEPTPPAVSPNALARWKAAGPFKSGH